MRVETTEWVKVRQYLNIKFKYLLINLYCTNSRVLLSEQVIFDTDFLLLQTFFDQTILFRFLIRSLLKSIKKYSVLENNWRTNERPAKISLFSAIFSTSYPGSYLRTPSSNILRRKRKITTVLPLEIVQIVKIVKGFFEPAVVEALDHKQCFHLYCVISTFIIS
jgi:hypothetical protein